MNRLDRPQALTVGDVAVGASAKLSMNLSSPLLWTASDHTLCSPKWQSSLTVGIMEDSMWNAGDVVQLKSGGPIMTIRWCQERNGVMTAWCDWFDKSDQKGHGFMPNQLEKYDQDA